MEKLIRFNVQHLIKIYQQVIITQHCETIHLELPLSIAGFGEERRDAPPSLLRKMKEVLKMMPFRVMIFGLLLNKNFEKVKKNFQKALEFLPSVDDTPLIVVARF